MKHVTVIRAVIATPGKTCFELSAINNLPTDQLSSVLRLLAKRKLITRSSRGGVRRSVKAWRYWPIYDIHQQEATCEALHELVEAQTKRRHNARNRAGGYTFEHAAMKEALGRIMAIFGRGLISIQ